MTKRILKLGIATLVIMLVWFVGFYMGAQYARPPVGEYRLVHCPDDSNESYCKDDYITVKKNDQN